MALLGDRAHHIGRPGSYPELRLAGIEQHLRTGVVDRGIDLVFPIALFVQGDFTQGHQLLEGTQQAGIVGLGEPGVGIAPAQVRQRNVGFVEGLLLIGRLRGVELRKHELVECDGLAREVVAKPRGILGQRAESAPLCRLDAARDADRRGGLRPESRFDPVCQRIAGAQLPPGDSQRERQQDQAQAQQAHATGLLDGQEIHHREFRQHGLRKHPAHPRRRLQALVAGRPEQGQITASRIEQQVERDDQQEPPQHNRTPLVRHPSHCGD